MNKNDLLRMVAPCGLVCYTCDAFKGGVINDAARKLLFALTAFDGFLAGSPGARPIAEKYNTFKEVLEYLAGVGCQGCREDKCLTSGCPVPACTRNKGLRFCYECPEFPCTQTGFDEGLKDKWIRKNTRIKEIGLEEFFAEEKQLPHYAS